MLPSDSKPHLLSWHDFRTLVGISLCVIPTTVPGLRRYMTLLYRNLSLKPTSGLAFTAALSTPSRDACPLTNRSGIPAKPVRWARRSRIVTTAPASRRSERGLTAEHRVGFCSLLDFGVAYRRWVNFALSCAMIHRVSAIRASSPSR